MPVTTSKRQADDLLYPERQRCRGCREKFKFIVIDRQYCSYECAQVDPPDVNEHPRSCWTDRGDPKYCYFTPDQADRAARQFNDERNPHDRLHAYYCDRHHMWHVGYPRDTTGTGSSLEDWSSRLLTC